MNTSLRLFAGVAALVSVAMVTVVLARPVAAKGKGKAKATHTTVVLQTSLGNMTAELFDDQAPKTVANFIKLTKSGLYDGVKFHRIIKGFMVQTGDPNTKKGSSNTWGTGGSGTNVDAEFSKTMKHELGTLSMARGGNDVNSASSQFFICLGNQKSLDGQYSIFGKVTGGLDVLQKLGTVKVKASEVMGGEMSQPLVAPVLKKVTIKK